MIRRENLAVSRETFAAGRKNILAEAEEALLPHVREALGRIGLGSWEQQIVAAALDIFDLTAGAEVEEGSQSLDDLRDLFAKELGEALEKTRRAADREKQSEQLTRWIASMAHNAAMEAATSSDPDGSVGLEWVTMSDGKVRESHREADGQQVPTGSHFTVDGVELMYPGQPVGDPSVWFNCRCVARPTMLGEMAAQTVAAADVSRETFADVSRETETQEDAMEEEHTSSVIVALPAAADPVNDLGPEQSHVTLVWLGDAADFDPQPIKDLMSAYAASFSGEPLADTVSGTAVLGADKANVLLLDAQHLSQIRKGLLDLDAVEDRHDAIEQFPVWIPHLTISYPEQIDAAPTDQPFSPDTPPLPEAVTFDRIALWHGGEQTEFKLGTAGGPAPEKEVIHPEDEGFTQQMADEVFASLVAAGAAVSRETDDDVSRETEPNVSRETLRPWHGVLAPEGADSGDGRGFAARMLTMRDLPLPLKAQFIDDEGHKGSVVVGRIDEIHRDGGLIRSSGVWDDSPEADRAWALIEKKMWRGVSVDLDSAEGEVIEASDGGPGSIVFNQGRVCSATLCAIPAFAEAFVRNGTWEEFANDPLPTGEMVAIPDWVAPASLVASAAPNLISADFFRNPELDGPTPVTRGEDGYIFGHLAEWGTCHIGFEVCTTAPPSMTNYAYFLTGQVFTDVGPIAVGQLTVGGGHAAGRLGVRAAIAHYDNVGTAVADITVGEDAFGIWFAGRIRPWATDQQIHELFASGPSGDWRPVRSRGRESQELVAAHAVNVQGFPVARTRFTVEDGRQLSLIAAGIPNRDQFAEASGLLSEIRAVEFSMLDNLITTLEGK